MLFNSIAFVLNFLFLLLFLYIVVRKNRKFSENLEKNLLKVEHELQEAKQALVDKNKEIVDLKVRNAELEVILQKEREEKKKEIELLTKAEERLTNTFKALSLDALQVNNNNFLNLAKEVIDNKLKETESDFKKRQATINEVITPIKEKLEKFDSEIRELEKER
ncbi:MAG: DNA recombination protein RmuC, partial [Wolbachia endosymbiont of Halictus tumulorum]|nr:DNA recombination protein RmuC [Wolbachia endosymbiont of Halictus tumulorum]